MCWSEFSSYTTFILGTILNVFSYGTLRFLGSRVHPIILYWQFCLLMQLPEAATWNTLDKGGTDVSLPSRTAMFLNVLQPTSLFAVVWLSYHEKTKSAHVAIFMYLVVILGDSTSIWNASVSIAPKEGCSHLNLGYWTPGRTCAYVFATLFTFFEIPSIYWAIVNSAIFLLTLAVVSVIYSCGGGSLWCWLIFIAGPILLVGELLRAVSNNKVVNRKC